MPILNLATLAWTNAGNDYGLGVPDPVALTGGSSAASANALRGDDRVRGTGNHGEQGIGSRLDNGLFTMDLGNDVFEGIGAAGETVPHSGVGSGAPQAAETLIVLGSGYAGISLSGQSILNTSTASGRTLLSDNDVIVGRGGAGVNGGDGGDGIVVECGSMITTGDGADRITGFGGAGGAGGCGGSGGDGIYVSKGSSILTGGGADTITGSGGLDAVLETAPLGSELTISQGSKGSGWGAGIHNDGRIDTGAGRDVLDALQGGFTGCGDYYLGDGNDQVRGFGDGTFYGDAGFDSLLLPGTGDDYTITLIAGSQSDFTIQRGCETMTALSFERISFTGVTMQPV